MEKFWSCNLIFISEITDEKMPVLEKLFVVLFLICVHLMSGIHNCVLLETFRHTFSGTQGTLWPATVCQTHSPTDTPATHFQLSEVWGREGVTSHGRSLPNSSQSDPSTTWSPFDARIHLEKAYD